MNRYTRWIFPQGDDGLRGESSVSLSDGSGPVKYSRWITPETLSVVTKSFWVQIDTFTDNDEENQHFDHVEIKRNKIWDNACV
ncbi:hypothetical protein D5R81_14750 [Parashewanella spongiae]|uniref:Uncharacterized protein n=1 Tax=Parashewanella spongiae TaxID=342950 RepID=A0A3A6U0G1_9GAMM|nr:hypothetical protein [Parashewanella spongiae]MCL1079211.1 hypothetical protein [Parashewanella spongiae]RJY10444.1 hypothetical protein D5R81_14750 [Parashewanella spongiae]